MPVLLTSGNDCQKNHLGSNSHGDFLKGKHFSASRPSGGFHVLPMALVLRNNLYFAWVAANSTSSSNSCAYLSSSVFLLVSYFLSVSFTVIECLPYTSHGTFNPCGELETVPASLRERPRLSKSERYAHISSPHSIPLCYFYLYLSLYKRRATKYMLKCHSGNLFKYFPDVVFVGF